MVAVLSTRQRNRGPCSGRNHRPVCDRVRAGAQLDDLDHRECIAGDARAGFGGLLATDEIVRWFRGSDVGADLLGACVGALLVIPLLHAIPTPLIAAGCGLPPLLALAQYGVRWRVGAGIGIVAALLFSPLFQVTRTKSYDENFVSPIYEKWTPIARLTLFDEKFDVLNRQERGFTWGRGTRAPRGVPIAQYWLEQDASAGTPITKFTGDLRQVAHLMFDVTTLGYQIRPPQRVVIIGSGGGRDILTALISGANDVHAVELNRHTIETVSDRYGEFSGNIYRRPGVRAIEREGRSYLTHSDEQFDLIQISLIDSWAASAAGAFALAENNLYTVEAFELYLKRLSPGGLLSTSRWMNEIPRLIVLSRAALASNIPSVTS